MLPLEAFADVFSFLTYYDLGCLKLVNKLLSAVAEKCADEIRLFDFSDFAFNIFGSRIEIYRIGSDNTSSPVCRLEETSEENMAEFILEAFRNCIVGRILLGRTRDDHVLNAIKLVTETVTVDALAVTCALRENAQAELVEFVESFRRVKVRAVSSVT
ncbi:hypothetical protein AAVH_10300 [Aphelenchoides avenae]|nr:hypothetical protein AAVH_10300 [Aphelenchus avenae]